MKITKNRKQMLNNFDTTKVYEPLEAIKILKEKSYVKFKETIDVSINFSIFKYEPFKGSFPNK